MAEALWDAALAALEGYVKTGEGGCLGEPVPFDGVGSSGVGGVVLKRNMAFEAGGAERSAVAVVFAERDSMFCGSRCESLSAGDFTRVAAVPFRKIHRGGAPIALVVMVVMPSFVSSDYEHVLDALRAPACGRGCMLQASCGEARLRVSKAAVRAGVDAQSIARAVCSCVRRAVPGALRVEVMLALGDDARMDLFRPVAQCAHEAGSDARHRLYEQRGVDLDCPSGIGHCGGCKDKDTCDVIRRLGRERKASVNVEAEGR